MIFHIIDVCYFECKFFGPPISHLVSVKNKKCYQHKKYLMRTYRIYFSVKQKKLFDSDGNKSISLRFTKHFTGRI